VAARSRGGEHDAPVAAAGLEVDYPAIAKRAKREKTVIL
jgi:hypothetical protein